MLVGNWMAPAGGIIVACDFIAALNADEHAIFCSFDKASNFFIMSSGFVVPISAASVQVVDDGVNIEVPPLGICMPPVAPPAEGIEPPVGIEVRPVPTIEAFEEQAG
jgi:hypothetical protein